MTFVARNWVLSALQKGITKGCLNLFDAAIGQRSFRQLDKSQQKPVAVSLTVRNKMFWLCILLSYDIGCESQALFDTNMRIDHYWYLLEVSGAYIAGEFKTSDLKALLNVRNTVSSVKFLLTFRKALHRQFRPFERACFTNTSSWEF